MIPGRFPVFFGYGSLVNRATHDHAPAQPARLAGWRRLWRHTRLRPFAYLSAEPVAEPVPCAIDGLVAAVSGADWAALDAREAAYRRHRLGPGALPAAPAWAARVEIYAVDPRHTDPVARHPILLSYLDTVVQGFLREFGPEGGAGFFATTANWGPVLDDRAAPLYPRHQRLSRTESACVDDHITALGLALIAR